jgi:hypothetical protein
MTRLESSVSDAKSCGVILTTRGVIYNHDIFIIYAPRVVSYALRNIYSIGITHDDCHIFIVKATGLEGLMEFEDNILLIIGNPQGILDKQHRPEPIQLLILYHIHLFY